MARSDLEHEILELRFKHYTTEIRTTISYIVRNERCEDTSDAVIDGLWHACQDDLLAILAGRDVKPHSDGNDSAAQLSTEAREVIRTYIDQARSYEAELADSDDDYFEEQYQTTIGPIVKARRDRRAQSARERDRWAFFNELDASADFERWRDRLLTPAQAVALSFNKDPDVVTPESLQPYRRVGRSPFREAFKDRLDLIEAAVATGNLSVPMSVADFAKWATAHGLVPPPELTGEDAMVVEDAAVWKAKYEVAQRELEHLKQGFDKIWPKSRISIYKIILGMALARFEHKTIGNTNATSAILQSVEDMGMKIDESTILTYLEEAASKLDVKRTEAITWSRYRRSPT